MTTAIRFLMLALSVFTSTILSAPQAFAERLEKVAAPERIMTAADKAKLKWKEITETVRSAGQKQTMSEISPDEFAKMFADVRGLMQSMTLEERLQLTDFLIEKTESTIFSDGATVGFTGILALAMTALILMEGRQAFRSIGSAVGVAGFSFITYIVGRAGYDTYNSLPALQSLRDNLVAMKFEFQKQIEIERRSKALEN